MKRKLQLIFMLLNLKKFFSISLHRRQTSSHWMEKIIRDGRGDERDTYSHKVMIQQLGQLYVGIY